MPNTVVKLTNAESTWLEAAREDRKLLINMKAHLQRCAFCLLLKAICKDVLFALLSFGSGFKVQGSRSGFAAFFRGWISRIVAFPSRGRCPAGADRADIV